MNELEQALADLRDARQSKNENNAQLLQAVEQRARLDKDIENARRQSNGQALEMLIGEKRRLDQAVESLRADYLGSKEGIHGQLHGIFEQFGTPQRLIEHWNDNVPILLFPVRLETRFLPTPSVIGAAAAGFDLLIRVFPDEATVVQHEPVLTDKEVEKGKIFWLETWKAADEAGRFSAWQAMVNGTNSHRAAWIVRRTKPFNLDTLDENLLVFPKKEDLPTLSATEYAAGKAYWRAKWMATAENTEGSLLAAEQLAKAVGEARAEAVANAMQPLNSQELSLKTPKDVFSQEALYSLELDDVTPTDKWRRATYTEVLPDKFVFIGYRNNKKIFEELGKPVADRIAMSPDPKGIDSKIERDADGTLHFTGDVAWVKDFNKAVEMGMGIRITLPLGVNRLDRLLVTGLNVVDGANGGVNLLEKLFQNHRYAPQGMAFVPTGTPTNNMDGASTTFIGELSAEDSFKVELGKPLFENPDPNAPFYSKADGQRLAEALAVDPSVFQHIHQSDRHERAESQAMNVALWNATLGYYLPQMLKPLMDRPTIQKVFDFFTRYVSGRGSLPTLRIGSQPYGILPTTDFQKWTPTEAEMGNNAAFDRQMLGYLKTFDNHWKSLVGFAPHIDANSTTPDADFLKTIGLDGGSQSYAHRMLLEKRLSRMFHWLFWGIDILPAEFLSWQERVDKLTRQLGLSDTPEIAQHAFGRLESLDDVPVVDTEPLSETALIKPFLVNKTDATKSVNYIKWLRVSDGATIAKEVFKNEENKDVAKPATLLYSFLRHSVQQSSWDAVMAICEKYKVVNASARFENTLRNIRRVSPTKVENNLANAATVAASDLTKQDYFDARIKDSIPDFSVAGNPTFGEYISQKARILPLKDTNLPLVLNALAQLENLPTARLERLFAEHIDTCSYRLDAWIDGVIQRRLEFLRPQQMYYNDEGPRNRGTYLAAFGWLENIENKTEGQRISARELPEKLQNTEGSIFENSANGGFIHAPSLNHATTAALLRNGYLTHSKPEDRERLTVNLSSERVRKAIFYLEGIRNGQELSALLGYDFERRLHDGDIDTYIYRFRDKFPFKILEKDTVEAGKTLDVVAARNVVDGYALIEAVRKGAVYPYDVANLPLSNTAEALKIQAAVNALQDAMDAIADVTLSESVHQFVQGNHASGGASLKLLQEGHYPSIPDVVQTPRSGNSLTHRVVLNLDPSVSAPVPALNAEPWPRATADPAVNDWLTKAFGGILDTVKVPVRLVKTDANPTLQVEDDTQFIELEKLKLQPVDVVFLVGNQLKDLEKRLLYQFRSDNPALPAFDYLEILPTRLMTNAADLSFGEVLPMLRQAHDLLSKARPLNAVDYRVPSESKPSNAQNVGNWDIANLSKRVKDTMKAFKMDLLDPISLSYDNMVTLLKNPAATPAQKWADVTLGVATYITLAANKWEEKFKLAATYDLADAYPSAPMNLGDPSVFGHINADFLSLSATPESQKAAIDELQRMFSPQFFGAPNALFTFNFLANTISLKRVLEKKMAAADAAQKRAEAPSVSVDEQVKHWTDAAKSLLGSAFVLVPHCLLENAVELNTAFGNKTDLFDFKVNHLKTASPGLQDTTYQNIVLEEWLQGIGRVRNRMGGVERLKMAAETLDLTAVSNEATALTPVQLPYLEQKYWVALDMPETFTDIDGNEKPLSIDRDYLSLTAMNLPDAHNFTATQCGLLLDAWTELVPNKTETTGVVAHHNQPNSEPAQCLLLAISPTLTGKWTWDNLLGTLNDTLNRAKTRAVEPDTLYEHSLFAQLLPAVTTVHEKEETNISMNFSQLRTNAYRIATELKIS